MKTRILDADAIAALRPSAVGSYLRAHGWTLQLESDHGTRWVLADRDVDVLLPRDRLARDAIRRLSELLTALSVVEDRSELEIYRDLTTVAADIVRVQVHPLGDDPHTIPLDDGVGVFSHARNLLMAAACSTADPRPFYPTRKPGEAVRYLEEVRLGQTERGSFVATLLSPVAPLLAPPSKEQLPVAVEIPDPYSRRVVAQLVIALQTIQTLAAAANVGRGSLSDFEAAAVDGVSANLCDALAGLGDHGRRFTVSTAWSLSRPAPAVPPATFDDDTLPVIREAARQLRARSPRPDVELLGTVVKLEQEDPAEPGPGRATMLGIIEGETRRITVSLATDDHQLAIEAYRNGRVIRMTGDLVREGRSFALADARGVRLMDDEEL